MKLAIDFIDGSTKGRMDITEGTCILHAIPMTHLRRSFTKGYLHRSGYYFIEDKAGRLYVSYANTLYEEIAEQENIKTLFVPELSGQGSEDFIATFEYGNPTEIGDIFGRMLQTAQFYQSMELPVVEKAENLKDVEEMNPQNDEDFAKLLEGMDEQPQQDTNEMQEKEESDFLDDHEPEQEVPCEPHTEPSLDEIDEPLQEVAEEKEEPCEPSEEPTEGIEEEETSDYIEEEPSEKTNSDIPCEAHTEPSLDEMDEPLQEVTEEKEEPCEPHTEPSLDEMDEPLLEVIEEKEEPCEPYIEPTEGVMTQTDTELVDKLLSSEVDTSDWFREPEVEETVEVCESGEYSNHPTVEEEEAEPQGYDEVDHVPWFFIDLKDIAPEEEAFEESSEPVSMGFDAEISFGDMTVDELLQKAEVEAQQEEQEEKNREYPFYLNSKGTLAEGEYIQGEGFLLHKGARVCHDITPSCSPRYKDLREQAVHKGQIDENNCTTEDLFFKTANDASGFVLGSNPGNQTNWHTCNGLTLREQTVGVSIPKQEEVEKERQNFFTMKRQGLEANLYYDPKERMFWVLKGQRLCDINLDSCSQDIQEWRYILRRIIDDAGYLKETIRFSTAARATSFIYGQNGIRMANWKNKVQLRLPDVVDKESA